MIPAYAFIPLIAPKPFEEQTPESFASYIDTLYICPKEAARKKAEKAGKKPASDLGYRENDKGTRIITVRNRKPKWAFASEIRLMAKEHSLNERELFVLFTKKKIEIRRDLRE